MANKLILYFLVLTAALALCHTSALGYTAEELEECQVHFIDCTPAIDITDNELDKLHQVMMEKVVGDAEDPIGSWGIPARGNYLDPRVFNKSYGIENRAQYSFVHYLYQLGILDDRRYSGGPLEFGDDFYDLLMSRMKDASYRALMGEAFTEAGVGSENVEHFTLAAERYFDLIEAESLARHSFKFGKEELQNLVETAKKRRKDCRRLFRSAMNKALAEVAENPEAREPFIVKLRDDLYFAQQGMSNHLKAELDLLGSMNMAVAEGEPFENAVRTCLDKEKNFTSLSYDFSQFLFIDMNTRGLSELRHHPGFLKLIRAMEEFDGCTLNAFAKHKNDPRSLLLLNATIGFGESWARSKKRIHYGDDLLFIDEVLRQAWLYRGAFLQGGLNEANADIFLDDGAAGIPKVKSGIQNLLKLRERIIALKDKGGVDAPADKLFEETTPVKKDVEPGFSYWLTYDIEQTPKLRFGVVKEEALNRMQLGRIYNRIGSKYEPEDHDTARNYYEKTYKHLQEAVTLAPSYWEAWDLYADNAAFLEKRFDAALAYGRAVELVNRCNSGMHAECAGAPQSGAELGKLLHHAGYAQLMIGDYGKGAELLARAEEHVPDQLQQPNVEWLAVARFGSSDHQTAWDEYRKQVKGKPLPAFTEWELDEEAFLKQKEPPAPFMKMLRAGFADLGDKARREGRTFNRYLHTQNMARVEAFADKHGWTEIETRDLLLDLYLELSKGDTKAGYQIEPALSPYAAALAQKAEKEVDRGRYIEAERDYRAALASDPWWLEGLHNLARLEFINWGHCGPDHTLDWMSKALKSGVAPQDLLGGQANPYWAIVDDMQSTRRALYEEADRSGSGKIIGLCDKPGASYIRPDRAIPE